MLKRDIPCALTAAGSDSGGGAGIEADLLAFAANGVHGCAAISAVTAQNPSKVCDILPVPENSFSAQLEAAAQYYKPRAAKTGMLYSAENVRSAAEFFARNRQIPLVVDPVMIASSGAHLLKPDAALAISELLIPLSSVFTPNLDEAAELARINRSDIASESDMSDLALRLAKTYGASALLKGGHLHGDNILDILAMPNGHFVKMPSARIAGVNTHGSGCTLSAAIAANLARGLTIEDSCRAAQNYLLAGMKNPISISGELFINKLP